MAHVLADTSHHSEKVGLSTRHDLGVEVPRKGDGPAQPAPGRCDGPLQPDRTGPS
jgi:hypothetical protein